MILTLTYHYFCFLAGGFFPSFGKECNGFFCVTLFSARSPEPSDSLEVEAGSSRRGCDGRLIQDFCLTSASGLLGGTLMAYPFWQYCKARVELALHEGRWQRGRERRKEAGQAAFDASLTFGPLVACMYVCLLVFMLLVFGVDKFSNMIEELKQ